MPAALPLVLAALLQTSPNAKGAASYEERVDQILASVLTEDALLRRAGVTRLVELGPEAIPAIEKAVRKGNHHRARTAAIALGEIGDEAAGEALARYFKERKPGVDEDVAIVAAYGLGACPGAQPTDALYALAERQQETVHVRLAAAFGLARRTDRACEKLSTLFQNTAKHADSDPELTGVLALALARVQPTIAKQRLPGLLKDTKDPATRAGLWLGAVISRADVPANATNSADAKSNDPVLARCAVLGLREVPRKGDNTPMELRESRLASLALGSGDQELVALAVEERELLLRPMWFGAVAARGWTAPLLKSPWPESEAGERGRFEAAALLAWKGGFSDAEKSDLRDQAKARWKKGGDADPVGAALLLAVLADGETGALLQPDKKDSGTRSATARVAWKFVIGELDKRRFEQSLMRHASEQRVLPERWVSDAMSRYAGAVLGIGSQFFERQSKLPFPPKLLLPPQTNRRPRTLPEAHEMYSDLFNQLGATPFDAGLNFPPDDRG